MLRFFFLPIGMGEENTYFFLVVTTGFSNRQPFLLIISLGNEGYVTFYLDKHSLYQGLIFDMLHLANKTLKLVFTLL